jgi:hypothetical protein
MSATLGAQEIDPPAWAVDYWVDLCKREVLEDVVRDIRRFVEEEMYSRRTLCLFGVGG